MKTLWLLVAAVCTLLTTSCGNHRKSADWRTSDDVHVAMDETFRPIMEELLETFQLEHVETTLHPIFCSEDSAIRLMVMDSVRCCVATRELNANELEVVASHNLGVRQAKIAIDAFALIVNKENPDTLITMDEVRGLVSGKITRWEQMPRSGLTGEVKLVFDDSGSSTVRYMRDSLCNGQELKGNLYAQGSNPAVIETVKSDPTVIGVVGTNWLKGDRDSAMNSFEGLDVKVLKVSRDNTEDAIGWKPYQYRILTGDYPLIRSVYVMTTDPRVRSNVKTLFFFMKGQKGQTIICNSSQMLPNLPVQNKSVNIN